MKANFEQLSATCAALYADREAALERDDLAEGARILKEIQALNRRIGRLQSAAGNAKLPVSAFEARQMSGRCGANSGDRGQLFHAVSSFGALCGREPGARSNGFSPSVMPLALVDCPRCKALLAKRQGA